MFDCLGVVERPVAVGIALEDGSGLERLIALQLEQKGLLDADAREVGKADAVEHALAPDEGEPELQEGEADVHQEVEVEVDESEARRLTWVTLEPLRQAPP